MYCGHRIDRPRHSRPSRRASEERCSEGQSFFRPVAEFLDQQGSWGRCAEVRRRSPRRRYADYAFPWKLQAQIYLNKLDTDKEALNKALDAFPVLLRIGTRATIPSGYLERYSIYVKKVEYDKASDELSKVFAIYPRYPNLHYYKGLLYAAMLNHKTAVEELRLELRNNPKNTRAMISLREGTRRPRAEVAGSGAGLPQSGNGGRAEVGRSQVPVRASRTS